MEKMDKIKQELVKLRAGQEDLRQEFRLGLATLNEKQKKYAEEDYKLIKDGFEKVNRLLDRI